MDFFTKPVPLSKTAIAGVVTDGAGNPQAWASVLITGGSPAHQDIAATTNGQGQYRFDGLVPGTYTLLVNAGPASSREAQVNAKVGELARLDFTVD